MTILATVSEDTTLRVSKTIVVCYYDGDGKLTVAVPNYEEHESSFADQILEFSEAINDLCNYNVDKNLVFFQPVTGYDDAGHACWKFVDHFDGFTMVRSVSDQEVSFVNNGADNDTVEAFKVLITSLFDL